MIVRAAIVCASLGETGHNEIALDTELDEAACQSAGRRRWAQRPV